MELKILQFLTLTFGLSSLKFTVKCDFLNGALEATLPGIAANIAETVNNCFSEKRWDCLLDRQIYNNYDMSTRSVTSTIERASNNFTVESNGNEASKVKVKGTKKAKKNKQRKQKTIAKNNKQTQNYVDVFVGNFQNIWKNDKALRKFMKDKSKVSQAKQVFIMNLDFSRENIGREEEELDTLLLTKPKVRVQNMVFKIPETTSLNFIEHNFHLNSLSNYINEKVQKFYPQKVLILIEKSTDISLKLAEISIKYDYVICQLNGLGKSNLSLFSSEEYGKEYGKRLIKFLKIFKHKRCECEA